MKKTKPFALALIICLCFCRLGVAATEAVAVEPLLMNLLVALEPFKSEDVLKDKELAGKFAAAMLIDCRAGVEEFPGGVPDIYLCTMNDDDQQLAAQFFADQGVWICLYDADLAQMQTIESDVGNLSFTTTMQEIMMDGMIDRGSIGDYVKVGIKNLQGGLEWFQWMISLLEE